MPLITLDIPFVKKTDSEKPEKVDEACDSGELQKCKEKLVLYSLIIDRYSRLIEEKETKSIALLKMLIKPGDETVKKVAERIKSEFEEYNYEKHFLEGSKKAVEYILGIKTVRPPITFWVDFSDVDKLKIGDEMDKVLFLCSLLLALDSGNAKVIVNEKKKPYVMYDYGDGRYIIDIETGETIQTTKMDMWIQENNKFLYSFNNKEYEDLQRGV